MSEPESITPVVPKRRRRRWPWVILIVLLSIALIAVSAEIGARMLVASQVRGQLIQALNLPGGQEIDVQTEGIVVQQLLEGELEELHVTAQDVTIGALHADFVATVKGVPIASGPIGEMTGTMRIHSDQFTRILRSAGVPLNEVEMAGGQLRLRGTVSVIGVDVPVGLGVAATLDGSTIMLSPTQFEVASVAVDLAGLFDMLGPAASTLEGPFPVCIADRIPRAIALSELRIDGDVVELDFSVDGRIRVDASLRERGLCPIG